MFTIKTLRSRLRRQHWDISRGAAPPTQPPLALSSLIAATNHAKNQQPTIKTKKMTAKRTAEVWRWLPADDSKAAMATAMATGERMMTEPLPIRQGGGQQLIPMPCLRRSFLRLWWQRHNGVLVAWVRTQLRVVRGFSFLTNYLLSFTLRAFI